MLIKMTLVDIIVYIHAEMSTALVRSETVVEPMASSLPTPAQTRPTPSSNEQSQALAELSTIFPTIDYNVLVSVLQAHSGRMDTTVEYLMDIPIQDSAKETGAILPEEHAGLGQHVVQDMVGQFSEDIGGLPELLPSFLYDNQQEDSSEDETSSVAMSPSPSPDSNVDSADDPLPTYEEACTDADRLPPAVYIPDIVPEDWPTGESLSEDASRLGSVDASSSHKDKAVVKSKNDKSECCIVTLCMNR